MKNIITYLRQKYKHFHAKNIIWFKFTINSLFKLNWRHCSAISLTVVMCVSVTTECACIIPNLSAKQCDWLFHARPALLPFFLVLFPDYGFLWRCHRFPETFQSDKTIFEEISQYIFRVNNNDKLIDSNMAVIDNFFWEIFSYPFH